MWQLLKSSKNQKALRFKCGAVGTLIQLLLKHDLVDELQAENYPLTLGKGKKLFDKRPHSPAFTLTESWLPPGE